MTENVEIEGERSNPELAVLEYRYNELLQEIESKKESIEKEGAHFQRMLRLMFIIFSIIIAGVSTVSLERVQSLVFGNPICRISILSFCFNTRILTNIALFSLLVAAYLYLRGASGGLPNRIPKPKERKSSQGIRTFEKRADYLEERIDSLGEELEDMQKLHKTLYRNLGAANMFLFFGFSLILILVYTFGAGEPIEPVTLYIPLWGFFIIILFVEWRSPTTHPLVEWMKVKLHYLAVEMIFSRMKVAVGLMYRRAIRIIGDD